jgi:hypothetical protein
MKGDFRLIGLSKNKSFTCSNLYKEDIFWPKVEMPQDRFDALFKWASEDEGFWGGKWIAEIEHDGLYEDGTPIRPVAVAVREWDLPTNQTSNE